MSEEIKNIHEPEVLDACDCDCDCANPPATVYEVVMASMTPETLASLGVKLISVNNSELCWLTSVGRLYPFNAQEQAIAAELAWLNSEIQE